MSALSVFLRKEALEISRTWRIWLVPGLLLFVGLSSPILASIMPKLLESVARGQPGVVLSIPPPSFQDAFSQWLKNLDQLVLWVVIISSAGSLSGELRAGTAAMVLCKPLSRGGFVLARALSSMLLLVISTGLGGALLWASTRLVFGPTPLRPLVAATAIWLVFALAMMAIMILLSALMSAQLGAAGLGVLVLAAVHLSAFVGPLARWGPAALLKAMPAALRGEVPALGIPLGVTAALGAGALALAAWVFSRREL